MSVFVVDSDGHPRDEKAVGDHVDHPARRARLIHRGHPAAHVLLASRDARGTATAIQELAGHVDLKTTQRYMHLSPAALASAIRLLETGQNGDIVETEVPATKT